MTALRFPIAERHQKSPAYLRAFRRGGDVAARENCLYDGMKLEVVNEYKYVFHRFNIFICIRNRG